MEPSPVANKPAYHAWYELWDRNSGNLITRSDDFEEVNQVAYAIGDWKDFPLIAIMSWEGYSRGAITVREYNDKHADMRDKKNWRKRYGMKVVGNGLKTVILPLLGKKAQDKKGK